MEQLEIHNKSYIVRWLSVPKGHRLRWYIQPQKQSINIGVIRQPSNGDSDSTATSTVEPPPTPRPRTGRLTTQNDKTTIHETLQEKSIPLVKWIGRCDADVLTEGSFDVPSSGMYGVVFDNTFSKQTSKFVRATLATEPIAEPGSQVDLASTASDSTAPATTAAAAAAAARNVAPPSLPPLPSTSTGLSTASGVTATAPAIGSANPPNAFFAGTLLKKRRKKSQGYARRLFSIDYRTSTLSYYKDQQSTALRGAIPLGLAAVSTDSKARAIVIDSGAEVWHLKAASPDDYTMWQAALERALAISEAAPTGGRSGGGGVGGRGGANWKEPNVSDRLSHYHASVERSELEEFASNLTGLQASVQKVVQMTEPRSRSGFAAFGGLGSRKSSRQFDGPGSGSDNSSGLTVPEQRSGRRSPSPSGSIFSRSNTADVHSSCLAISEDLGRYVSQLRGMIDRRAGPVAGVAAIDGGSVSDDEFFDAEGGASDLHQSRLMTFTEDADGSEENITDAESDDDSPEIPAVSSDPSMLVMRPTSLTPLPIDGPVTRRAGVPEPKCEPPSIREMFTKATSGAAPVTANEPLSMLQKFSEQFEYANLLDEAVTKDADSGERILYVTAFAISYLSSMRSKPRSKRKPFNPLLGETFELVREDLGFRLVSEKVQHNPVQLAIQAESKNWAVLHSPNPTQQFLGLSVEIITSGEVHVLLHPTGDHYCYDPATTYLRNAMRGEKYVEPAKKTTVMNTKTKQSAVVEFEVIGRFSSGRGEGVTVKAFGPDKDPLPLTMDGSWTRGLKIKGGEYGAGGKSIWEPAEDLEKSKPAYGFTSFAASLNEVTAVEEGKIAPTDSRLRPDQRLFEQGETAEAEQAKLELEQKQRDRREAGVEFVPRWFVPVKKESVEEEPVKKKEDVLYRRKAGPDGYWEQRAAGEFTGCLEIYER